MADIIPDMSSSSETRGASYDAFAQFLAGVDKRLHQQYSPNNIALLADFGSGTGRNIEHLAEAGKLKDGFVVYALDIDSGELKIGQTNLHRSDKGNIHAGKVYAVAASVESVPLPNQSVNAVSFPNAVHLTDPYQSIAEARRILKEPGGVLTMSSAYMTDIAYPDEVSEKIWEGLPMAALFHLRGQGVNIREVKLGKKLLVHSMADYVGITQNSGFKDIQYSTHVAELNEEAFQDIVGAGLFVRGVFPTHDIVQATDALKFAAASQLKKYQVTSVKRGFGFIRGTT